MNSLLDGEAYVFRWGATNQYPNWSPAPDVPVVDVRALSLAIEVADISGDASLVGTSEGVFFSELHGHFWTVINEGLTDLNVRAVSLPEYNLLYGHMFVGTEVGIWRRPLSEVSTSVIPKSEQPAVPIRMRLNGNHTVSFSLPARTPASLTMHDLSGRTWVTLLSGELSVGNHTSRLDAAALPVGLYFVRLQTPDFTETRRVLLAE